MRAVEGLGPGDHACLVYDSEERRDETLAEFFARGIARGDRVLYIAREPDDPLTGRLAESAASPQLAVLESRTCYLHDGVFDPDAALAGLRHELDETTEQGFVVLRAAGGPPPEVTCNGFSHLLRDYEQRAGELFADQRYLAICAYDVRRTKPEALLGIVDAHPVVLYAVGGDARLLVEVTDDRRLRPCGWIDVTTLGALVEPLWRAVRSEGGDVTLELGAVDFVDVAGLRLFAEAGRVLAETGRRLLLAAPPTPVPAMLRLLGYDRDPGLVLA